MGLFFTYETELPAAVGFPWYGVGHWGWLVAILIFCCLALVGGKKLSYKRQKIALRALSLCSSAVIVGMECYFAAVGYLSVKELPLHLCAMAPFLTALHAYTDWDWLSQVVYALCLPGAVAALLFPGWSNYPLWSFMGIEGFLSHGLILTYCLCALGWGRLRPRLTALWKVWVFLALVVPPIYWLDTRYDCNYWFVTWPAAGSPLEALARFGSPGYLVAYGLLALGIMVLMELPFGYSDWKKARRKAKRNN
jgi:hypothetical integral membrane protein (TIGR02206 family)